MNLQDLIFPIGDLLVWTFEALLETPIPNLVNWGIWFLIGGGILGWLRMQTAYTKKAVAEGGLV